MVSRKTIYNYKYILESSSDNYVSLYEQNIEDYNSFIFTLPKEKKHLLPKSLFKSLVLKSPNVVCIITLHLTSNKFVVQYQYAKVIPKKSNKKHWVGTFSDTLLRMTFISFYFNDYFFSYYQIICFPLTSTTDMKFSRHAVSDVA